MTTREGKRISFIVPSRGRSKELAESVRSIMDNAACPDAVELVARLDLDDAALAHYGTELQGRADVVGVVGPPRERYFSLPWFFEEAARQAVGSRWLVFWNDDMTMETKGWDTAMDSAGGGARLAVVTGRLHRGTDYTSQCQYACCAVTREIYEACGRICLGDDPMDSVDRVWAEFCRVAGCERTAAYEIGHTQDHATPDRDKFYRDIGTAWEAHKLRWKNVAERYARMCMDKLK